MLWQRISTLLVAFWHLCGVMLQMLYGTWKVAGLPKPVITIFGGSRFTQQDPYAKEAHKLAQMFADAGISVITGGGGGIMQAATCGALPHKHKKGEGKSLSIGVQGLEKPNKCVQHFFMLRYFFARKWLMTRFSNAFVVFPGGFGTMDELYEILVLIQANKMPKVPIVLVGSEYWKLWIQWLNEQMLGHKIIRPEDAELFVVADDLDEVFCLVRDECTVDRSNVTKF